MKSILPVMSPTGLPAEKSALRTSARLRSRPRVKCGKAACRCAGDPGYRHGPYTYFRWERWDAASGRVAYYRE